MFEHAAADGADGVGGCDEHRGAGAARDGACSAGHEDAHERAVGGDGGGDGGGVKRHGWTPLGVEGGGRRPPPSASPGVLGQQKREEEARMLWGAWDTTGQVCGGGTGGRRRRLSGGAYVADGGWGRCSPDFGPPRITWARKMGVARGRWAVAQVFGRKAHGRQGRGPVWHGPEVGPDVGPVRAADADVDVEGEAGPAPRPLVASGVFREGWWGKARGREAAARVMRRPARGIWRRGPVRGSRGRGGRASGGPWRRWRRAARGGRRCRA